MIRLFMDNEVKMRKLVTIRQISDLQPIDGADQIEVAIVNGWTVVVQKGLYQVGDLAVYHEIDSMLPESIPAYQYLVSKSSRIKEDGTKVHVLRTIRLRGQLSQGFLVPLKELFSHVVITSEGFSLTFGDSAICGGPKADIFDVSLDDFLGIEKYEKPLPASLAGMAKGNFPSFLIKTDCERIQNIKSRDYLSFIGKDIEVSEKLDGTSCTVSHFNSVIDVCSRNLSLQETEGNTYWTVAKANDLPNKLIALGRNLAIQGEIIGHGIQGNSYNLPKQELFVFNIYDIDAKQYLSPNERLEVANQLGLKVAPVIEHRKFDWSDMKDLLSYADGNSLLNPKVKREGVVIKFVDDTNTIIKAISNAWLLKQKD